MPVSAPVGGFHTTLPMAYSSGIHIDVPMMNQSVTYSFDSTRRAIVMKTITRLITSATRMPMSTPHTISAYSRLWVWAIAMRTTPTSTPAVQSASTTFASGSLHRRRPVSRGRM